MLKDTANKFFQARSVSISSSPTTFKESIGGRADRFDVYRFQVRNRSSFTAQLDGLRANANLALFDGRGKRIQQSRRPGTQAEAINVNELQRGTYFLRVGGSPQKSTSYRLIASTGAVSRFIPSPSGPTIVKPGNPEDNTAPSLFSNGLSVGRGNTATITSSSLRATDAQQPVNELTYTITNSPKAGRLFLNGNLLGTGSTFTQADLDSNRVTYQQNPAKSIASGQIDANSLKTSGVNAVWAAQDGGDTEIFFFNGSSTKQLTDNAVEDSKPQIFGDNVVWQSGTGANAEIYLYRGSTGQTVRLTDDDSADTAPQISDSYVVWQNQSGGQNSVQFYSLSSGTLGTIANSTSNGETEPLVAGNKVAFVRDQGIFFADLSNGDVTQASNNGSAYTDTLKGITGDTVVWQRRFNATGDSDILYSTNPTSPSSARDVNASAIYDDTNAIVADNSIAFIRNQTNGNAANGIYLFNLSSGTDQRLTGSVSTATKLTGISGTEIVGQAIVPGQVKPFIYQAGSLRKLDGGAVQEGAASVSGNNLLWLGGNSLNNPNQVFLYDTAIRSDSFSFTVSDGGLATNGTLNIAIS